ncbi:serine hydrolase [Motilimonas sp. E26]|uniref:serine hydrolase domain-containing protein n=1 Tax=Motilimonas sp. E26 TaxID=2865674 RepID=UPI001E4FFC8C|nr:serine hydrolase [Motilimonas sp. E26]MCE0556726.1 beta-lactamase family protein [Motilimonas sp. E26]
MNALYFFILFISFSVQAVRLDKVNLPKQGAYEFGSERSVTIPNLKKGCVDGVVERAFNRIVGATNTQQDEFITSVLVYYKGKPCLSYIANGHGDKNLYTLNSVTKSITSILVGVAIDKGFIDGVGDAASKYISVSYNFLDEITIHELLTMSANIKWNNNDVFVNGEVNLNSLPMEFMYHKNPLKFISTLSRKSVNSFEYNEYSAYLLGKIIEEASGLPIHIFAKKYLFDPLDINYFEWTMLGDKSANMSGGLWLTTWDVAKIGQLIMNRGVWRSEQVVSSGWVDVSTKAHTKTAMSWDSYGYLWWLKRQIINGKEFELISARGTGGQTVIIMPEQEVVAVITGNYFPEKMLGHKDFDRHFIMRFLTRYF